MNTAETIVKRSFEIGDWIFNPVRGRNERIVDIAWDDTLYGHTGGWRYWVPGYGSPDPLPEIESQPYYNGSSR